MALEYRKIERFVKGVANYNRLKILELLEKEPELSVADISEKQAKVHDLEHQIDELVYKLYGLADGEIKIVEETSP